MKPIFAIDITNDKKNLKINGSEFIIRSLSKENAEKLQSSEDKVEDIKEKAKLPLWLRIIKIISEFAAFVILIGILRGTREIGLAQGYANAPYLFWICGACFALWGALALLGRSKEKEVMETSGADHAVDALQENVENALTNLNVPEKAINIDVIMFRYVEKHVKIIPKAPGMNPTPYINVEMKMFLEGEKLCIADVESVYAFPLSEIKGIKKINKRISVMGWNKKDLPNQGRYKPYKMTVNNMGCIFMKPYYALDIERDGNAYEIYFPCYELPVLEGFTKLHAEN